MPSARKSSSPRAAGGAGGAADAAGTASSTGTQQTHWSPVRMTVHALSIEQQYGMVPLKHNQHNHQRQVQQRMIEMPDKSMPATSADDEVSPGARVMLQ